jgi:hypothetical protein
MTDFDRFDLMLPCYVMTHAQSPATPGKLCLQVSRKSVALFLLRTTPGSNYVVIVVELDQLTEFRIVTLPGKRRPFQTPCCTFSGPNRLLLTLFFLDDLTNLHRFVFTLAESGLIVPLDLTRDQKSPVFRRLLRPSFLPTGNCDFSSEQSLQTMALETVLRQLRNVDENRLPAFPGFSSIAVKSFYPFHRTQLDSWVKSNPEFDVMEKKVDRVILVKWLLGVAPPSDEFSRIQAKLTDLPVRIVQDIDSESLKFPNSQLFDETTIATLAPNILKAAYHVKRVYFQEHWHILQKVVELIRGQSGIPGDDEQGVGLLDRVNKEEEFIFSVYQFLIEFFDGRDETGGGTLTPVLNRVIDIVKLNLRSKVPCMMSFLYMTDPALTFLSKDISAMFSSTCSQIWTVWYWIFTQSDHLKAFGAFSASVIVVILYEFIQNRSEDVDSGKGCWIDLLNTTFKDLLNTKLKDREILKTIMRWMVYFYVNSE